MPSLKDIRRRISSVKNTQKITRAQKLVSVAKFARAVQAVSAARPYGKAFDEMVSKLAAAAGGDFESPLLEEREEKRILIGIMSTDRGFCGGLNSNLFKATLHFIAEKRKAGVTVEVMPLGKRARQFSNKMSYKQIAPREGILAKVKYEGAKDLSTILINAYENEGYDHVYVAYVEFKSAMTQVPKVQQLLPILREKVDPAKEASSGLLIVEPSLEEVLASVLKRAVIGLVFRFMLEGSASEHGARMTAMDSATNNANEVLRLKKIEYNRARQAAITKELIEITSGAQAV